MKKSILAGAALLGAAALVMTGCAGSGNDAGGSSDDGVIRAESPPTCAPLRKCYRSQLAQMRNVKANIQTTRSTDDLVTQTPASTPDPNEEV